MKNFVDAIPIILVVVMVLLSTRVSAQSMFTASFGVNRSTVDTIHLSDNTTLANDFSDEGWRAAFDIEIAPFVAFQVGWSDFGSNSGTVTLPVVCPASCPPGMSDEVLDVAQNGSGMWLAYAPTWQHESWSMSAKLGVARAESVTEGPFAGSRERSETGLMLGAGVTYWFSDRVGIRGDAERLGDMATQFGIGLAVRF